MFEIVLVRNDKVSKRWIINFKILECIICSNDTISKRHIIYKKQFWTTKIFEHIAGAPTLTTKRNAIYHFGIGMNNWAQ
jgi:hypothetical protein